MEIAEAIKKRRTLHIFSKKRVPREVIEKSIFAANQAPCHRRTFPWRFTSIGIKKRELLYQLQLTLKFGDMKIDESSLKKIRDKMLNPSHLLVATQVCTDNQVQKLEDYAACACAIQNLSLSLVGDDVGCKWSTGKITKDPNTYKIAQINSSEEEIIGFIWIGYGTEPPLIKRPLISTIYRERD
ncbi:nitroreductase family protein [Prochlorococcus marinus]|uniref:nitroreductase family protein n=1 Tax=Prochlorococcus marinus TaxID=1219 RepID=UPI0022B37991|nr:nitroreductase family protein [Prochlorococcus marinus]